MSFISAFSYVETISSLDVLDILVDELPAFIEKYELSLANRFIVGQLRSLEKDGIFVPDQVFFDSGGSILDNPERYRPVLYFNFDYRNRIFYKEWKDKELGERLVNRRWKLEDLKQATIIKEGKIFSDLFWLTCLESIKHFWTAIDKGDIIKKED